MRLPQTPLVVAVAALAVACHTPNTPSNSVVGSQPNAPSGGSAISYYDQPVTLVVSSSVATGGVSTASTVEVATDTGFTNIVATQVPTMNASGQLTVTLNHLSASTTYYWRVKTTTPDGPTVTSAATSFTMGPPLVIQAPTVVTPVADTYPHKRPTFTVTNAAHTGPAATLTYHFDVASDAGFSNIVATGALPEGSNQTSFMPSTDLTPGSTYYWRAQASDTTKGVVGPFSSAQPFTTANPDDGTYRYVLTVHMPPACFVNVSIAHLPSPDYMFDNALTVAGNALRFSVPDSNGSDSLVLDVRRSGARIAGTFGGMTSADRTIGDMPSNAHFQVAATGGPVYDWYIVKFGPTAVAGTADYASGRLSGTFDGAVRGDDAYPGYGFYCIASGFAWTLTPH